MRQPLHLRLKSKFIISGLFIASLLFTWTVFAETTSKNGFNLSNSRIPAEHILSGGPPRDGIPSIDQPSFIEGLQADFMNDDDRVLAIHYQGVKRAYPIKILNWHEIVNDTINDRSVIITYCPLCGTGLVYDGMINGNAQQFGVSGLLYNSDVLLYDRRTESLWSQILAEAVSGELAGTALKTLPVRHTSWKQWLQDHPDTAVLSTDTGFNRDYNRSPYAGYDDNEAVYFPLQFTSKRFHPKERVLGIQIGNQFKAYPFAELAKTGKTKLTDTLAGKTVTVEFDVENRDGQVFDADGEPLNAINSFWFAWFAFHPDTEVYKSSIQRK